MLPMTSELEAALSENTDRIREGLQGAEMELRGLLERVASLEETIARAHSALGESTTKEVPGMLTLHRAIDTVLADNVNEWMRAPDLAGDINRRGLYRMRDGRSVEPGQIHARVRNYDDMFERDSGRIRLRYVYETRPIDALGSYGAAATTVTDTEGNTSVFVTRVSYTEAAGVRRDPEAYAVELSEERARAVVRSHGFSSGHTDRALLTTHGWESFDET